jgi:hypothetical protein
MERSLPFSRLVHLIKAIEDLPVPLEMYSRNRMEYDYILGRLCLAESKGKILLVSDFTSCIILGSQPTINKRIKELVSWGLVGYQTGDDKRHKLLVLSPQGRAYLEKCSDLMIQAIA